MKILHNSLSSNKDKNEREKGATNVNKIKPNFLFIASFLAINYIQQRITLGRRRQILIARFRNQDAILHTHAANGVIPLQHIPLDEASVLRVVAEVSLEIIARKVASRFPKVSFPFSEKDIQKDE